MQWNESFTGALYKEYNERDMQIMQPISKWEYLKLAKFNDN